MRSSDGQHFSKLDHVRAVAALMVFCWHFGHAGGFLPYSYVPPFPLSMFEEGHAGVGLFMTLSGYLFSKIIRDRQIQFLRFVYNRALRLGPLLVLVLGINLVTGGTIIKNVFAGFIVPVWPNGGWSIAVEGHFYLILPFILAMARRFGLGYVLAAILVFILLRTVYFEHFGTVQRFAYYTIFGRIDQFILGIVAERMFRERGLSSAGRWLAAAGVLAYLAYMHVFNVMGGYFGMPADPSTSPLWIFHQTLEGMGATALILLYDKSAFSLPPVIDRALCVVGELSFSVYLLHFFFYERAAILVAQYVDMSNYAVNLGVSLLAFTALLPLCWLSNRLIERPFMRLRVKYIAPAAAPVAVAAAGTAS